MSLLIKSLGLWKEIVKSKFKINSSGTVVEPVQGFIKNSGTWVPIWTEDAGVINVAFGVAQFSDTDFTGGKLAQNQAGQPYDTWTGVQDFIDSALTLQPLVGNSVDIADTLDFPYYGYFAHPASLGLAQFADGSSGFPGGWDGIEWEDGGMGSTSGPKLVQYDDGTGLADWYVYRTNFSGIGESSWTVSFL